MGGKEYGIRQLDLPNCTATTLMFLGWTTLLLRVLGILTWVLQMVLGYLLELTSTWYQRGAPCPLINQHQPAVEEEVLAKAAIRKVEPSPWTVHQQTLSNSQEGWILLTYSRSEAIELAH